MDFFFKSPNIITEIRYIFKEISKKIFHRIPHTLYAPDINFQRSYRGLSVVCLFVNSYLFNSHYYNFEYCVFHSWSICSCSFASQHIVCNKPCSVTLILHGYNFVYGIHIKLMTDTDKHVYISFYFNLRNTRILSCFVNAPSIPNCKPIKGPLGCLVSVKKGLKYTLLNSYYKSKCFARPQKACMLFTLAIFTGSSLKTFVPFLEYLPYPGIGKAETGEHFAGIIFSLLFPYAGNKKNRTGGKTK